MMTSTMSRNTMLTDVEAVLEEQLQDDRLTDLRTDTASSFIETLPLPDYGDTWIPGYKLIPISVAKEFGMSGFEDWEDMPPEEPGPDRGAVVGNLVETFVDGVTWQQQEDVMMSTLLAQMAANWRIDKNENPMGWTRYYGRVLENIGWVVPTFDFREMRSNQTRFTMDSAIIKVISGLLTQDQLTVVKAGIDALKSLNTGDGRLRIFQRNSVDYNAGNIQVNNVGSSASGRLSMALSGYHFKTNERVTNVLWFSFSGGSTQLSATRSILVLNETVYARVRDQIVDKLGNSIGDFVRGLPDFDTIPPT